MVDIGTYGTSVALVTGGGVEMVPCPVSGVARWPSCLAVEGDEVLVGAAARRLSGTDRYVDAVRAVVDAGGGDGRSVLAGYLAAVRAEADRSAGAAVDRLTLVVPVGYGRHDPRRAVLRAAAADAGLPDAVLVDDAVSAVEAARATVELPDGAPVLVCDVGLLWTVTVVRADAGRPVPLGTDAATGFDALLADDVRATAGGDPLSALAVAREVKHRLTERDEATGWLAPEAPYRLTRPELERFAEPALRWLLAAARAVVARSGFDLGQVAAVILVGGGSRLPVVAPVLRAHLGRPVVHLDEPELAVVRGAATWAARTRPRAVAALPAPWHLEPLVWNAAPGATLARWLVAEGDAYTAGDVLARAWADERLVDLTASDRGVLVEHRIASGGPVRGDLVAAVIRPAGREPEVVHRLRAGGGFALLPDRERVVAWPLGGGPVTVHAVDGGAVVAEVRPALDGEFRGAVYARPDGRPAFVTWDPAGGFAVWDVPSGDLLVKFTAGSRPLDVRVDERAWRLVAAVDRTVRAGRYRHAVAVVHDLATGDALDEVVGTDPLRRFAAYGARSARDGFAAAARGDGVTARAVRIDGEAALTVTRPGRETVHGRLSGVDDLRVAFDAGRRHLLSTWTAADGAHLEIRRV